MTKKLRRMRVTAFRDGDVLVFDPPHRSWGMGDLDLETVDLVERRPGDEKLLRAARKNAEFTKYLATELADNDPKAPKGKRWDYLSDALNEILSEARELHAASLPKRKTR